MSEIKIGAQIVDINRVYAAVDDLANIDKDKAVKAGLRAGAMVFLAGGRRRLKARMKNPKGVTGNLLGSFKCRVKRYKLGALAGFNMSEATSIRGFTDNQGKGYHAHLVDGGTTKRITRKGANRGAGTANRFWSDTVAQDDKKALEKVYQGIEKAVIRIKNK